MKKATVEANGIGWTVFDARGNQLSMHTEKNDAEMAAHYYRMSVTLTPERLHMAAQETGSNYRAWQGRPYYGVSAFMCKHPQTKWTVLLTVDGVERERAEFSTRKAALQAIADTGRDMVETYNCLNRDAGTFLIERSAKGGCCDPATETYHSM